MKSVPQVKHGFRAKNMLFLISKISFFAVSLLCDMRYCLIFKVSILLITDVVFFYQFFIYLSAFKNDFYLHEPLPYCLPVEYINRCSSETGIMSSGNMMHYSLKL
uniref:Uncharacterized protein n=1 Tax=Cacopsylla melanoneura TaxID=428564 RepID=A0A8D8UXL1_9HEMI